MLICLLVCISTIGLGSQAEYKKFQYIYKHLQDKPNLQLDHKGCFNQLKSSLQSDTSHIVNAVFKSISGGASMGLLFHALTDDRLDGQFWYMVGVMILGSALSLPQLRSYFGKGNEHAKSNIFLRYAKTTAGAYALPNTALQLSFIVKSLKKDPRC